MSGSVRLLPVFTSKASTGAILPLDFIFFGMDF
jgi:hypothetical protein